MSQYLFSGAALYAFSFPELKNWKASSLSKDAFDQLKRKFQIHKKIGSFDALVVEVESFLEQFTPEAQVSATLNGEQSLVLALILQNILPLVGDLYTKVGQAKAFDRAYKKWTKILFEKPEAIEGCLSAKVGSIKADSTFLIGWVSAQHLSTLRKVDDLQAYLDHQEIELQRLASGADQIPKLELILDLNLLNQPVQKPILIGLDGESLAGNESVPKVKKPKLNELEKEEQDSDIDTTEIGPEFVRGVAKTKKLQKNLVVLSRWTEILRGD